MPYQPDQLLDRVFWDGCMFWDALGVVPTCYYRTIPSNILPVPLHEDEPLISFVVFRYRNTRYHRPIAIKWLLLLEWVKGEGGGVMVTPAKFTIKGK